MNTISYSKKLILCALATLSTLCEANPTDSKAQVVDQNQSSQFVVATWNAEHLAYPIDRGCKPRSEEEIKKMRDYAKSLNADIVGLQEVGSIDALALLFPESEWQLFISERPDSESYECRKTGFQSTQQKVAYAVKKGITVNSVASVASLGLGNPGLRHGLELNVSSPLGTLNLLNVHMKSGCFVDNYSRSDTEACQTFAQQAPIIDSWIEQQEYLEQPYVVLGDFNHRLSAPYNRLTREITDNVDGSASSLVNTTADLISCHPYYPAPIDHIFIGNMASPILTHEAKTHPYEDMEVENMLSDHCAMSLTLKQQTLPLTESVVWQTSSKEYRYLTKFAYQQAIKVLNNAELPTSSWTVVMDVDETLLDNSLYQVRLNRIGGSYASDTWAAWVAEEKAKEVPGALDFVKAVLAKGGKLALITNRNRTLDKHTWKNMRDLGFPITKDNTCLMGKAPEDKSSINHKDIINDKDLRRAAITSGNASCYNPDGARTSMYGPAQIYMQVGDNIEDFKGVTQEDADVAALLLNSDVHVLLPNAMYGSW